MNPMTEIGGVYLLLIRLGSPRWIQIGGLGYRSFRPGSYGYVGSGITGMKPRLDRHLKDVKKLHWHIDYLLRHAEIEGILYGQCRSDKECALADQLSQAFHSIPGFGSTDCRCTSHLFFSLDRSLLAKIGCGSFRRIELTPRLYWKKPHIGAFDTQKSLDKQVFYGIID
jgi:Uri superfamily endonuclease